MGRRNTLNAIFHILTKKQIIMKRIKSIGLIITLIMMFFGCETVDKDPAGERNVAVIPAISNVDPGIFDSKDLVNSFVAFKVDLPAGERADKATIVGSFKDNFERVKLADIASFPSTVQIVSGDVIQKLGLTAADVKNGDVFTLEVLTTAKGVTTRSNAALSISVACAFEKDLTVAVIIQFLWTGLRKGTLPLLLILITHILYMFQVLKRLKRLMKIWVHW